MGAYTVFLDVALGFGSPALGLIGGWAGLGAVFFASSLAVLGGAAIAARLRDRIGAVERTVERQQIVGVRKAYRDVFGLARRGGDAEVHVLHVREGRVIGAQGYPLDAVPLSASVKSARSASSIMSSASASSGGFSASSEISPPTRINSRRSARS